MSTMTSRQFNQNTSEAKRQALKEPVFITDRGQAAHVLLSIEEYRRLKESKGEEIKGNLALLLSMPADDMIDFDPPKLENFGFRPAEFD